MARLRAKLDEARAGHGALVMLVGEPGIGKSRTIEEFAEQARAGGALVLTGRCFEGEWAPPYAPFAEAIAGYAKAATPDTLRADLGYGAPPVARPSLLCMNGFPTSASLSRSTRTKSAFACSTPYRS